MSHRNSDERLDVKIGTRYTEIVYLFFIIFFFVLAPRLNIGISVHTGFVSVIVLVFMGIYRTRRVINVSYRFLGIMLFFSGLAIYHAVMAVIYDNNATYFIMICITVMVSLFFGWMLASYMRAGGLSYKLVINKIFVMCAFVAIVNSIVVLIEYFFPEVKLLIEGVLVQNIDGNINYATHPFRLRGVANGGGASLSVFNALMILPLIYFVINRELNGFIALLCAAVLSCANVFTGRTGLMLSLLFFLVLSIVLIWQYLKSGSSGFLKLFLILCTFIVLVSLFADIEFDPAAVAWAFEWVDNLDSGKVDSTSTDDLKSMLFLPDDPVHLLFGVGFFEGLGTIYSRTDSGYLKSFLSLGIPLGVMLYVVLAWLFFGLIDVNKNYFLLVLFMLSVMFFIEIKEPFFYQNYIGRVVLLLSGASMYILFDKKRLLH